MNRSFISALLSLVCFSTLAALAQSSGSTQPLVSLSVGANPVSNGMSLSGVVQPPIPKSPTALAHPRGTVTFFDGSTALNAGGAALMSDAAYRSATFAQTFGTSVAEQVSPVASWQSVVGDFNEDGTPDLLTLGTGNDLLLWQVFASAPGGKFVALPAQNFPFRQIAFPGLSVLDVDGDGHLDLLIGNLVVRGKGDGTFSNNDATILPVLAGGFIQAYAADINGDGKLDIIAVNSAPASTTNPGTVQFTFTVFRNDGGGVFTSLGSFALAPSFQTGVNLCCALYNIFGLSFADVNGDSKIDILSQNNSVPEGNAAAPNQFNVMLNNGDGTFGAPKPVDTSALANLTADGTAFGDINGDGKQDLVVAFATNTGANFVGAALGNGDGSFGSFLQLKLIDFLTAGIANPQVQLIDFNSDGKLDAVLGSGELALGNGDGTFSLSTPLFAQPANPQTPLSYPLLQADLFANSWPSLVYLNFTEGANAVFTPQDSSSANVNVVLTTGSHSLTARYSGDANYAASVSPAVTIDVAPAVTRTTVASSDNPSYAGESVTFTATIAGLAPGGGGTVTFSTGSTALGTAAVSKGSASFATTPTNAGNQIITAAYGGDANDAASSGTVKQAVEAPVSVGSGGDGSTTLTVASGQSVTTKVSVTGAAGFGGMVNFSCTGLPMYAACSFAPASVTVSGATPAATTLTVSTAAATAARLREGESARALTVLACGLPLLGLLALLPVARGRRVLLCLGFALFVSMTSLTGCGGNSSGGPKTAAGTYTFNMVASSGSATSTASYKLIVQ